MAQNSAATPAQRAWAGGGGRARIIPKVTVTQAAHEKVMSLARPNEKFSDVVARLADDVPGGTMGLVAGTAGGSPQGWDHEQVNAVYDAARALVRRLDTVTTGEFAQGAEREEREALRRALVRITAVAPDAAA